MKAMVRAEGVFKLRRSCKDNWSDNRCFKENVSERASCFK